MGAVKLYAKNNAYKAQEEELAAQIKEEEKRSEEVKRIRKVCSDRRVYKRDGRR